MTDPFLSFYNSTLINTCDIYVNQQVIGSANQVTVDDVLIKSGVKCRFIKTGEDDEYTSEGSSARRRLTAKIFFPIGEQILDTYNFKNMSGVGVDATSTWRIAPDKGLEQIPDENGKVVSNIAWIERTDV